MGLVCGNSSVGRAQPCQGWGREFESRFPLQILHRTPARPGFFFSGPLTRRENPRYNPRSAFHTTARWQSGHAAACKAVYLGSIPGLASTFPFAELPSAVSPSARRRSALRCARNSRRLECWVNRLVHARVVKLVDTRDLKSLGRKVMPVRVRPRAPLKINNLCGFDSSHFLAAFSTDP